ncbi:alpha/beta hydrolase [Herbaspirillum sp. WKF16]|uniref:alpha/beta fold hydrolase n=1 Tax=Herbaspirillum sp. WKF16 TaxID=3028312 RepID=UPI0023A9F9DF|nr:alpha/beta hydrolase [Herbaspirillum sp. WKF16]WDZ96914.1 alpha/beta hydrolase [Herbaspirillum sp. WKF16]
MKALSPLFSLKTGLGIVAAAAAFAGANAMAAAPAAEQPSVVIVHGAFADGSDWAKVIPLLQAKGIKVTAVQNPLTSLADDVAAANRAIDNQPGKVVLVGHSWGGTVITEAGVNDKVAGLVYVAAFAPDAGQATGELGKDLPTPPGIGKLSVDKAGFASLPAAAVASDFAQDVPAKQAAVMAATQGPIALKAFGEKVSVAAWKTRPSWYIVSKNDRMIQPDLERAFAKQIGAKTSELPTSHVPQQSRPADVAKVILDAVAATAK